MKVRWAVVVLIVAIIVMATGCSADSSDPTVTGDEGAAVATTEPAIGSSTESTPAPTTETPLETTPASTEPAPLPDPDWFEFSVGDLAFDESGTLWASGHRERGEEGLRDLYRLDGTEWQIVENSRVFSPPIRWELRAAPGGGVFVGADDGVYRTDGENWELYEEEFACGSLAVDSTDVLWATCPDFLTRLVDGAWDDVPEGWAAQSVATGADGSVWFTTFTWPGYELLRFDGNGWTSVAPCEDCDGPRSILGVDETGGAWVARGECGLDGLTRFDPSGSSEEFDIRGAGDLAFGPDGSMWFAIPCTQTLGDGGVGRLLDGEWRLYTTDDGLPSDNVQAVETAPDGTIVIGTERGVSTYDPATDTMTTPLETNVFSFTDDDLCKWVTGAEVAEFVAAEFDWEGKAAEVETVDDPTVACIWELSSADGTSGSVRVHDGGLSEDFDGDPFDYEARMKAQGVLDYQGPVCVGEFVANHPALSDGVVVHNGAFGQLSFAVPPDTEWLLLYLDVPGRTVHDWTSCEGSITTGGVASDDYEPRLFAVADHFLEELGWLSAR